jgi:6,7-dimethyl-8-ribityllumazine synthase
MSLDTPTPTSIDGAGMRFAIIAARYNEALVDSLVTHATKVITDSGATKPILERVPGAMELPAAAAILSQAETFDAIIVIGVVIAGDTNHHNIIGDSTAIALQQLSIQPEFRSSTTF